MTMMFKVPGPDASRDPGQGAIGDLKVGARVQFEFILQGDDYVLQSVKPAGGAR